MSFQSQKLLNMKKFVLLFALVVGFLVTQPIIAHSQEPNKLQLITGASHAAGLDTVTNAGTVTQSAKINGYNAIITIQTLVTKLTGTVGGVARLYGSLDNVNWDRLKKTDSLLLGNVAAQNKIWEISPSSCTYYRVVTTGVTGPMAATVLNTAIFRKPKEPK